MNRVQGRKEGEKWKDGSAGNSGEKKACSSWSRSCDEVR